MIRKIESENQKADFSLKVYKVKYLSGLGSCYTVGKPSYERGVARNDIFNLKWRSYGPKWDILDYWETLISLSIILLYPINRQIFMGLK